MEQAKLALVAKDKARIAEANQKIQGLNESFSKETEKKLQEKLEASAEKKNQQIKALQERLRDHVCLFCWLALRGGSLTMQSHKWYYHAKRYRNL